MFRSQVGLNETNGLTFETYPNPTSNLVYVSLKGNHNANWSVKIQDALGKELGYKTFSNHKGKLDLTQFANGVYFLTIKAGETQNLVRIVKR